MRRKFDYYFIRLLNCVPVMVTKEYFDWFLVHGKDSSNNLDVIRTTHLSFLFPFGSICATQIRVLPASDLHTEDDLPF